MASSTRDLNIRIMVLIGVLSVISFVAIFIGFEAVFHWTENWKDNKARESAVNVDRLLNDLDQEAPLLVGGTVEINGKTVQRATLAQAQQKLIAEFGPPPEAPAAPETPAATPEGTPEPAPQSTPDAAPTAEPTSEPAVSPETDPVTEPATEPAGDPSAEPTSPFQLPSAGGS
ncbi:MAG: hypothetical protein AAF288_10805 [Planctomycetota bacterium]